MSLQPGQSLSHYRIVQKLGEGGMGVVWKAEDTSLGRSVAIKILPEVLAQDPERLARFEREAKILASLNHPNIATIHELQKTEGMCFLAMEMLEGETVADRIARAPLSMEEVLGIARQVALGLEAAHENGVVHRDLKPANIQILPDGTVKVLDFGLAKAVESRIASGDPSFSPTMTTAGTVTGMLMGTAGYMSPEQARGRPVDKRADIWSFGCVLYEMVTGTRIFVGETVSDTLASILKSEPDWSAVPDTTPAQVRTLLARCLDKHPKTRLRDIGEARIALEGAIQAPVAWLESGKREEITPWRRYLPWAVSAVLAGVAVLGIWSPWRDTSVSPVPPTHLSIFVPESDPVSGFATEPAVAVSRDGRSLVYVARRVEGNQLFLRQLDQPEAAPMEGTEGATNPFFSPDGQWVGFFADGKLKKIPIRGGSPMVLADAPFTRGASWGPNDQIIYSPAFVSGLMRIPAAGGKAEELTQLRTEEGERTHRWPQVLPNGKAVIYTIGLAENPGYYDEAQVVAEPLDGGERKLLIDGASVARYVDSGHLVYARAGNLFAVPFDQDSLELKGDPVPVLQGVGGATSSGAVHFSISENGSLVYIPGSPDQLDQNLVWVDREGKIEPLPVPPRAYMSPRISPDGRRVVVEIGRGNGGDSDIWVLDLQRDTLTRLTFDSGCYRPQWSADGHRIFYAASTGQGGGIWWKPADGSEDGAELSQSRLPLGAESAHPDGKTLAFIEVGIPTESDIKILDLSGNEKEPKAILETQASEWSASFSPDGRWLAYNSDESGKQEIYVRSYPAGKGRWQVSNDGGQGPLWSPDGKELFYVSRGKMMVVPVSLDPTFSPGTPRLLFQSDEIKFFADYSSNYSLSHDGDRFLMIQAGKSAQSREIRIVLNWFEDLRKLSVPAP